MIKNQIELSQEFKSQTTKAILAIILFALIYLVLVTFAVGLTIACAYIGIGLIIYVPQLITIILGLGIVSLGLLVLFFILKFIFSSHKVDRSHLTEIKPTDEPELFNMIQEIVEKVGSSRPKKVYLSPDVNAAVFYNSSFWSMFFPVKKNLQIGLGLVNAVTTEELRAILAHEFGHFSQRTMKVGSYVYNVNQIIYNMLYENSSFENIVHRWANVSGFIAIFVMLAVKIIQGIQWILRKMYEFVNLSYMALSREMEFHADEIAANLTGYLPLKNSLLRIELAEQAYNTVLNFYGEKVTENIKSKNIYKEQEYVMNFYARETDLIIANELPQVTLDEKNRYNKSKLVIENQWASHPSLEERVNRLKNLNIIRENSDHQLSNAIFRDIEQTQRKVTDHLFGGVQYTGSVQAYSFTKFKEEFKENWDKNSFHKIYNGYYDNKNPIEFEVAAITLGGPIISNFQDLFSDEKLDWIYSSIALQNDMETLTGISSKTIPVKTFDYDGKKFHRKNSRALLNKLKVELEELSEQIRSNDINIYRYFLRLEKVQKQEAILGKLYQDLFNYYKEYEQKVQVYYQLNNNLQFINFTMPVEDIKRNFIQLEPLENQLKSHLREILDKNKFDSEITDDMRENFERYLSEKWEYIGYQNYIDKNLEMLFTALNDYLHLISRGFFLLKKEILDYQVDLIDRETIYP